MLHSISKTRMLIGKLWIEIFFSPPHTAIELSFHEVKMNLNIWCSWDLNLYGENTGDWKNKLCNKLIDRLTCKPYLLQRLAPYHRWRNQSWDFHKIALLVNNGAPAQTHIFWLQIPRDCHSLLCHPSTLREALSKPRGTAELGPWDSSIRPEASVQVGSIWGSSLML